MMTVWWNVNAVTAQFVENASHIINVMANTAAKRTVRIVTARVMMLIVALLAVVNSVAAVGI